MRDVEEKFKDATLGQLRLILGDMTNLFAPQIPPHTTLETTEVGEPFPVRLGGVAPQDRDVVIVRDQVVIDGRVIIRSASGEGFWHLDVAWATDGSIPTAQFEKHGTVCFSFTKRF